MYEHDERIVMTLDAGGTNFVFSAIVPHLLSACRRECECADRQWCTKYR